MKKKKTIYPPEFRKHIRAIGKELQWFFMLRDYDLKLTWHETQPTRETRFSSHSPEDSVTAASIWVDLVYLSIDIQVAPALLDYWKLKSYTVVLNCMVHEFAHILTEPLYLIASQATSQQTRRELEDVRERQTERIAKIFMENLPRDVQKAAKLSHAKDIKK